MTIAITGATGQLGRLVIAKLKERRPDADFKNTGQRLR